MSKEGVRIDPKRVEAIKKVLPPKNVKGVQSFLGQINFVRRFISNFAELVKPIVKILKKDVKFDWNYENQKDFENIKQAIQDPPILISPDYSNPFSLFSFASFHTIAAIFLQKDEEGFEHPIAFLSKSLQSAELNYELMEK